MQDRVRKLREAELELQLEETKKLKKHVFEFSVRLKQAQERLKEKDFEGKIVGSTLSAYHSRRHSCDAAPNYFSHTNQFNTLSLQKQSNSPYQIPEKLPQQVPQSTLTHIPTKPTTQESLLNGQKFPLSPSEAFKIFQPFLSPYEQSEIFEFREIYYIGLGAAKLKEFTVSNNFGFDDEKGDYLLINNDQVHYRYEVIEPLGRGAFGQVVKVFDHKSKEPLALKIIKNKTKFTEQAQTELKILHNLLQNDKKNQFGLVHIRKSFVFRNHFCLVFELLGQNLYSVLKSQNFRGLKLRYIRRYAFQLFQSLSLLSKLRIIHCDLKPENILLIPHTRSSIKVIDFGSSCYKSNKIFTYIQSRFYRAPEILFGIDYTEAIDVWSLGCILVELYTGAPLFPAKNEVDLFSCMVEVLGNPPEDLIMSSKRSQIYCNSKMQPRIMLSSKGVRRIAGDRKISQILQGTSLEFVDLIESKIYLECLMWKPEMRITPNQALVHSWFQNKAERVNEDLVIKHRYRYSEGENLPYDRVFQVPLTAKPSREKNFVF